MLLDQFLEAVMELQNLGVKKQAVKLRLATGRLGTSLVQLTKPRLYLIAWLVTVEADG